MQPGRPDEGHVADLSRRLAEQLAAVGEESPGQRDQGGHPLVQALIEQLAAGQSETLYGLHSAAAALRRRALELEQAAERIPGRLAPQLEELVVGLTEQATGTATTLLDDLQQSLSTETSRRTAELEAASQDVGAAMIKQGQEVTATLSEQREIIQAAVEAAGQRFREELEQGTQDARADLAKAQRTLRDAAARHTAASAKTVGQMDDASAELAAVTVEAVARIEAAAAAAAAHLTALGTELAETASQALDGIERAGAALLADTATATEAVTLVGENVTDRLIAVLDERDKREQLLDDRLTARIDRLSKKTETTMKRLMGELADEADLLRLGSNSERAATAEQLHEFLDRLLALPRGTLRELRTMATRSQEEDGS